MGPLADDYASYEVCVDDDGMEIDCPEDDMAAYEDDMAAD